MADGDAVVSAANEEVSEEKQPAADADMRPKHIASVPEDLEDKILAIMGEANDWTLLADFQRCALTEPSLAGDTDLAALQNKMAPYVAYFVALFRQHKSNKEDACPLQW